MSNGLADQDERTLAVENAGYRWSYHVLSFGALGIGAYRSLVLGQATWDILALVVVGGGVNAAYQASGRVLYPRWVVMALVTLIAAAALAAAMVLLGAGR
jgi:hypothetical protein